MFQYYLMHEIYFKITPKQNGFVADKEEKKQIA